MYTVLTCMFFLAITATYVAACLWMVLPDDLSSWRRLRPARRRPWRRMPLQFRLRSLLLVISALAGALTIARAKLLEHLMPGLAMVLLNCLILIALALLVRMIVSDILGDRSGGLAARRQNRMVDQIELPSPTTPATTTTPTTASSSPAGEPDGGAFDAKRREHKKWWNRVWPNRYRPYGSGRGYHVPENR